jgi:hypothetical protein
MLSSSSGVLLTFGIVVFGDMGEHWRSLHEKTRVTEFRYAGFWFFPTEGSGPIRLLQAESQP